MVVLAIWRYPVKAMLGERLGAVDVGPGGCEGDRRFVVMDVASGRRTANKRGLTDPRLRACGASLCDGELRVTLPDGAVAVDGEVADALSELLERSVRVDESAGDQRTACGVGRRSAPVAAGIQSRYPGPSSHTSGDARVVYAYSRIPRAGVHTARLRGGRW